jgi:hypothetical protein
MKIINTLLLFVVSFSALSSVPTEEGLLKNLNNEGISGNIITIKALVQNTSGVLSAPPEAETASKADYYKFIISLENKNAVSLLQIGYTNSQMLNTQIRELKYIPDLLAAIKREKGLEKGMFYSVLVMLTTNQSQGIEAFLEKSGVQITRNKNILNEDKMKLLRSYRTYLANNKGKGDASSPLNPSDRESKARVVELFRANTFQRSKNIELIKMENEFMWQVDWKAIKAYFSNEERRLRIIEFTFGSSVMRMTAKDYTQFNSINELPKFITFKDLQGLATKIQILGLDIKTNREKSLPERYEEFKKVLPANKNGEASYSFLF